MTLSDAASIAVRVWQGDEPAVLFVHATGFCKELWGPVVDLLRDSGEQVAAIAFDQRGHGESPAIAIPMDWSLIGKDVARVAASIDPRPRIAVGHSSGGAAVAIAAIADSAAFDHLVLIEPVTFPAPHERRENSPMAAAAERRRSTFPDRETARSHFAAIEQFDRWVDDALDAYVHAGLRDAGGEVVLRCSPATEAEHYRSGYAHSTWDHLGEIACPVTLIVGSESTTHHGAYLSELTARFGEVELQIVPEASHFVPMEHPSVIAEAILSARDSG